jgi:hypothetical protein
MVVGAAGQSDPQERSTGLRESRAGPAGDVDDLDNRLHTGSFTTFRTSPLYVRLHCGPTAD